MGRSHCNRVPRCAMGLWVLALLACGDEPEAAGGAAGLGADTSGAGGATSAAGSSAAGASGTAGGSSEDPSQTTTATAGVSGGALPFCEGAVPSAPAQPVCREDDECGPAGSSRCQVPWPGSGNPCGGTLGCTCPPAKIITCSSHDQCGTGRCFMDGPFGTGCVSGFCMPSCLETGCGDGFTCNDDRRCVAIACDAGFSCPTGMQCASGAPGADVHGCEPLDCDQGYACRAGSVCRPDDPRAVPGSYGCVIVRCDEPDGPECPVNTDCVAEGGGTGCTPRACERDTECDCGACVNGACAARPGICMSLALTGG